MTRKPRSLSKPSYSRQGIRLYLGDCLHLLPALGTAPFAAIVTDPPYHLTQASRGGSPRVEGNGPAGRHHVGTKGFMGKAWDGGGFAFRSAMWRLILAAAAPTARLLAFGGTRTWHRLWCAIEDAGWEITDTLLRLFDAGPEFIELWQSLDQRQRLLLLACWPDSSFLTWFYGQGFPKGKTCLKPCWEPICLARKAPAAPLAIDPCRIPVHGESIKLFGSVQSLTSREHIGWDRPWKADRQELRRRHRAACRRAQTRGRWPPNLLLTHHPLCRRLSASSSNTSYKSYSSYAKGHRPSAWDCVVALDPAGHPIHQSDLAVASDLGPPHSVCTHCGAFFWAKHSRCPRCLRDALRPAVPSDLPNRQSAIGNRQSPLCPIALLDYQSGDRRSAYPGKQERASAYAGSRVADRGVTSFDGSKAGLSYSDHGGASRFFYTAKAPPSERHAGCSELYWKRNASGYELITRAHWSRLRKTRRAQGNIHPTVKPLRLMAWLVQLVTPAGGPILDPFCGSGTTLVAAAQQGIEAVGIDSDPQAIRIAAARLDHAIDTARNRRSTKPRTPRKRPRKGAPTAATHAATMPKN